MKPQSREKHTTHEVLSAVHFAGKNTTWNRVYFFFACVLIFMIVCSVRAWNKVDYIVLHNRATVCDLHCDTVLRLLQGVPLGVRRDTGHIDIPRLKKGGIDLQAFACWVNPYDVPAEGYTSETHRMIDTLYEEFQANSESIALALSGSEAEGIIARGKIAALLAIEGGHSIMNSVDTLRTFFDRGVRYMTLTWNNSLDWADAAADTAPKHGGLTHHGKTIVRTMNEIGMIVDVSHAAESTFWDVIETTSDPIIASHSCVHALCPHFRNLKDDQIKAIARNGGMIGINFYSAFLDSTFGRKYKTLHKRYRAEIDSLWEFYKDNRDRYVLERSALFGNEYETIRPPVERVIDHIDYIVKLIGPEHVGLGSDFDGTSHLPQGLEDCSGLPIITKRLLERGYSVEDIKGILGGNFIRIIKRVCG